MDPLHPMNKKRKKTDCITIDTMGRQREEGINIDILGQTIQLFHNRCISVEDDTDTNRTNIITTNRDANRPTNWNQEAQNNLKTLINGHSFDLLKEANEKYNTLRNTVFLEILEKYKNNREKDFLSYDYLFNSILDAYKLLDEYDTKAYDPSLPRGVYLDNKIRVHNMVMKLICGSRQIDHSPSSMVVPLSDNLNKIMTFFHDTGGFNEAGLINTQVEYEKVPKEPKSITYDEIDQMVREIDSSIVSSENMIESISKDSRYLLFLKRTSPSLLRFCDTTEEYILRQEEMVREKGKANEAICRKTRLGSIKDLEKLEGIPPIEDVKWVKRDLNKFYACLIRYKNNFSLYKGELPHIPTKELVKKYYLSKDKTFSHIKKKAGRISDSEIKTIVEKEWTQGEIELFTEKYKSFGKNLLKYQAWINKTEKDLKIFLRYFLKQQKVLKVEAVPRPSITKEDLLSCWSIDERQIFAIYFPYFNKNWITMATYFPKKSSADLKLYYSKYFKGLSYNEQKFEASISNLKVKFRTYPVIHIGDEGQEYEVLKSIGIIFKR